VKRKAVEGFISKTFHISRIVDGFFQHPAKPFPHDNTDFDTNIEEVK
jgi:hypothetical protein